MDGFEGAILLPPPPFPQVLGFRRTTCSFFFSEAVSHHSPGWLWTWALASQMLKLQVCTSIHTTFGVLFVLFDTGFLCADLAGLGLTGINGIRGGTSTPDCAQLLSCRFHYPLSLPYKMRTLVERSRSARGKSTATELLLQLPNLLLKKFLGSRLNPSDSCYTVKLCLQPKQMYKTNLQSQPMDC